MGIWVLNLRACFGFRVSSFEFSGSSGFCVLGDRATTGRRGRRPRTPGISRFGPETSGAEPIRSVFQENRHHLPSVLPHGVCSGGSLVADPGRGYTPYVATEDGSGPQTRFIAFGNPLCWEATRPPGESPRRGRATVQGHGRRCLCGSSPSSMPCFWRKATNPRGLGTASPKAMEVRENRMSQFSYDLHGLRVARASMRSASGSLTNRSALGSHWSWRPRRRQMFAM